MDVASGSIIRINTSNKSKQCELRRFFSIHKRSVFFTDQHLREIKAGPLEVVVHKASQVSEGVVVEDTSLDVEDEAVGVEVKWLIEHLDKFNGCTALWRVLLAQRLQNSVYVYAGEVQGRLVARAGKSEFGFDPYFIPEGAAETLAEHKPDALNARYHAVCSFISKQPIYKALPITSWGGLWQQE